MTRLLLALVLLVDTAGCATTRGPFAPKPAGRPDDPLLPIDEQQRRTRDRYPLFDDTGDTGPKTYFRYGPTSSRY